MTLLCAFFYPIYEFKNHILYGTYSISNQKFFENAQR